MYKNSTFEQKEITDLRSVHENITQDEQQG